MKNQKINLINRQKKHRLPLVKISEQLNQLAKLEPLPHHQINYIFVTPKEITILNQTFLQHQGPTDVITFQHGEIIICPEIAKQKSVQLKIPVHHELLLYAIHGWLHLRGYDDKTQKKSLTMHKRQTFLLKKLLR